jgi:hypothetical protein
MVFRKLGFAATFLRRREKGARVAVTTDRSPLTSLMIRPNFLAVANQRVRPDAPIVASS